MVGKFSIFINIAAYVGNGKRKALSYYGSVIGSHRTRLRLVTFDDLE